MGLDEVSVLQLTTKTALFRSIYDEGIKVRLLRFGFSGPYCCDPNWKVSLAVKCHSSLPDFDNLKMTHLRWR